MPCSFFRAICDAWKDLKQRSAHDGIRELIQHCFELAAERYEDLTPLVYRRLFREHPEAQAMFRTERSELVRSIQSWILPATAPGVFA